MTPGGIDVTLLSDNWHMKVQRGRKGSVGKILVAVNFPQGINVDLKPVSLT